MPFSFYENDGASWTVISAAIPFAHWYDAREGALDYAIRIANREDDPLDEGIAPGKATSNPGVDSIFLTPAISLTQRANSTAYTVGQERYSGLYRHRCTTAGTSAASLPTMATTPGDTTTDGTAVWTCIEKMHQVAEIKLATTQGGLAAASPGAALNLGTELTSGDSGVTTVWIRVTNAILAFDQSSVDIHLNLTALTIG